jgi:glycosyltransferase involved in cell wall biosynthesis
VALGFSVIVCTRHRPELLGRCLASLAALDGPAPELIVVDNSEGDSETERVADRGGARYLVETEIGLSRARNTGIDAATTDLIAFLDDDAVADPAWLQSHLEVLSDDSLVASTGRIVPINAENGSGMLDLGAEAFVVDRTDPWWFERANFGGVAAGGSNMVVKRQTFDDGLRFNEALGVGSDMASFEEHHFLFTLLRRGGRVAYVPGAVVRHRNPEPLVEAQSGISGRAYRYNAAYLTMLLVEEPGFRSRTLRYVARRFFRDELPWRHGSPPSRPKALLASCGGPLQYVRSRLARRNSADA